jgi:hypothetical protein
MRHATGMRTLADALVRSGLEATAKSAEFQREKSQQKCPA